MHVLPLPFGLALALLPRPEAVPFRKSKAPIRVSRAASQRERILGDINYADGRQHII